MSPLFLQIADETLCETATRTVTPNMAVIRVRCMHANKGRVITDTAVVVMPPSPIQFYTITISSYQMLLLARNLPKKCFSAPCHVQLQHKNERPHIHHLSHLLTQRHTCIYLCQPPTLPICEITAEWQCLACIESPCAGCAGVSPYLP